MSESASHYVDMVAVEQKRQQQDLMYHLIVNTEADTLDDMCKEIVSGVQAKYDGHSIRLKNMLARCTKTDDRVAKHGLLLFALTQEPTVRQVFTNPSAPRAPPEKFKRFVEEELPALTDKLLRGAFTSLRAFVEEARYVYTTL